MTLHEPARAWPGVSLLTDEVSTCMALDMGGRELWRWFVQGHDQVEHFELLDGGRIVAVSVDQGVTLLDADSKVAWQVDCAAHHDVHATTRGTFLVPVHTEHDHAGRRVRFDAVVELDAGGEEVGRWRARDHLDALRALHGAHALDEPAATESDTVYDYHHLNTVLELDHPALGGEARLLCLRNVSLLVAVDPRTGVPGWSFGPGELDFPHDPSLTPEGRLLVFDNGFHRGWSRLVEIDPATREVVWSWAADPPESFFSEVRGACQRLPNGNTLVTESERGRAFELDPDGNVVWRLEGPRRIYRVRRVAEERLAFARGR